MRLIDADALIDNIPQADLNNDKKISKCGAIADMVLLVCDAPTIDAVPVVRCRECMYRQKAKVNRKGFLICPASGMEITDDDFCSYGERKED